MAGRRLSADLKASRRELALGLAATLALPPAAEARIESFPVVTVPEIDWLPFERMVGGPIRLAGAVNGHPVDFVLDNGTSWTLLDQGFAKEIGVKDSGSAISAAEITERRDVFLSTPVQLAIGQSRLPTYPFTLLADLTGLSTRLEVVGGKPVKAVLGREVFEACVVDIDFNNNRIAFRRSAGFKPPPNAVRAEVTSTTNFITRTRVSLDGLSPIWAAVDLGDADVFAARGAYVRSAGLLKGRRVSTAASTQFSGAYDHEVATLERIAWPGTVFHDVPIEIDNDWAGEEVDANIGLGLSSRLDRLILDTGKGQMFMVREDRPQPSFARDHLGFGVEPVANGWKVMWVARDGPAEAIGLKPGALIRTIGGKFPLLGPDQPPLSITLERVDGQIGLVGDPPKDMEGKTFNFEFNSLPIGAEVHLTLDDGTPRTLTLAEYY